MAFVAVAQDVDSHLLIMSFCGVTDPQDMDAEEFERLDHLLSHPMKINRTSMSALIESGLMSQYQAASFCDYVSRHGAVLSFAELSAIDGFGEDYVKLLSPFVSLESVSPHGMKNSGSSSVTNELQTRTSCRLNDGAVTLSYSLKYRMTFSERLSFSLAANSPHGSERNLPSMYSGNLVLKKSRGKLVFGDYNLRCGHGLVLWSGMSISGFSSVASLQRNPTGLTESWSFSGTTSMTGMAVDFSRKKLKISTGLAMPGIKQAIITRSGMKASLMPYANLAFYGKKSRLGVTAYIRSDDSGAGSLKISDMKTSADWTVCLQGVNLFSELAYDWCNRVPAVLLGSTFPVGETVRAGVLLRHYPIEYNSDFSAAPRSFTKCSNEEAATLVSDINFGEYIHLKGKQGFGASERRHQANLSFDAVYSPGPRSGSGGDRSLQFKLLMRYKLVISPSWSLSLRLNERLRSYGKLLKTDLRTDLSYSVLPWYASLRFNVVKCSGIGLLTYSEAGFKSSRLSAYLRAGIFKADDWDDRIYAYERDAPGSFNVPAYYGRGFWTALNISSKIGKGIHAYLRASCVAYPFMQEENKKPGKAELKLQFNFDL